ncbi:serine-type endopeptidase [Aureococcus anophagefferens]|nr:serine-type endopeptidase [Aureococcus anophagefferens]
MRPMLLLLALAPLVGGRRPRRLEKLASDYDSLVSAVAHDETTSTVRVKLADSATPVPLEHAVGGAPRRTFRPAGVHEARHVAAGLDRWWSFTFPDAARALEALEAMLDDELLEGTITTCELAMKVSSDDGPGDPSATYEDPDDPYYDLYQKRVFESLRIPDAWALGAGRTDVVVQIIDTGSQWHADLVGNRWENAGEVCGNGLDDDGNGYVDDCYGYNHADGHGGDDLSTYNSHGVHCAGNVAASTNNGVGIAGVAGDGSVTIMTSVLFGNTATMGDAEALVYGADNGAHVSSNSWSWLGSTSFYGGAVQDAIDYADGPGRRRPAAAGNDDDDNWHWPARYDRVYAVAATDATGAKASFSNYGDWVDFAAPGESIVSLVNDGGYSAMSGTSMSTPLVAGIVAFGLSLTNDAALVNRTLVRKPTPSSCVSDIDTPSSPPSTTPRPTALETAAPTDAFCTEFVLAGGACNDDKMGTYAVLPGEFCGGKHKYRCVDCAYELDLNAYYYSGYPLWAIGEKDCGDLNVWFYSLSGAETPDLSTETWYEEAAELSAFYPNAGLTLTCASYAHGSTDAPSAVPTSEPTPRQPRSARARTRPALTTQAPNATEGLSPTYAPTRIPTSEPTPAPTPRPTYAPSLARPTYNTSADAGQRRAVARAVGAPVAAPTTPRPSSTPKPTASYCTAFALSGGFSYNGGKLGTYRATGDFCDGRPVYACVDCAYELELTAFYYAGYPLWAIGENGCGDLDVWFYSPSTAATPDLADGWYEETDATSQFAFNGDLALTCVSYDLGVPAPTGAPTPRPRPTPTRPTSPAPEPAPTAIAAAAPTAAAGYDPSPVPRPRRRPRPPRHAGAVARAAPAPSAPAPAPTTAAPSEAPTAALVPAPTTAAPSPAPTPRPSVAPRRRGLGGAAGPDAGAGDSRPDAAADGAARARADVELPRLDELVPHPTCGGCDAGDEADDAACQDSSSWYSKKSKNAPGPRLKI